MKQGEVWRVNLDPAQGAEIRKTRPALLVGADALGKLPLKVIVPVTDWKERYGAYPWMVKIEPSAENGLVKASAADCFQIRSVSTSRLIERIGSAAPDIISRAQEAILTVIGAG